MIAPLLAGLLTAAPTYAVDWAIDLPATLIPLGVGVGWLLKGPLAPAHCAPRCDEADLAFFDRFAAGNHSQGWSSATDVAVGTLALGTAGYLLVTEGWSDGAQDLLIALETLALSNAVAVTMNLAAARPRPVLYGERAPLEVRNDPDSRLSFFSGHATAAAAATTFLFSTARRRDPGGTLQWVLLGVGAAATAFVAAGRVQAGKHFPSDVTIGAMVGASVGFLVPALHDSPVAIGAGPGGAALTYRFD